MNTNFLTSKHYFNFLSIGLLPLAKFLIILTFVGVYMEFNIKINEVNKVMTIANSWVLLVFAGVLLILNFILKGRIAYIEFRGDKVFIETEHSKLDLNINQVESIRQIQFIYPPFYKLKVKENLGTYYFVIHKSYVDFCGYVKDLSMDAKRLNQLKNNNNIK